MDHFILPLLLPRFQQEGSYFPHAALERADLQRLIASWGETLQFPENVATAPFGIGKQPGHDLLPHSRKGVFVGTPPARDAFSPLLLVVQGMESCRWIGCAPRNLDASHHTISHRKDPDGSRRLIIS